MKLELLNLNGFVINDIILVVWRFIPCNFRRWNLGEPKKLFLIVFNLERQWWLAAAAEWGDPGGVMGVNIFDPKVFGLFYKIIV